MFLLSIFLSGVSMAGDKVAFACSTEVSSMLRFKDDNWISVFKCQKF